MEVLVLFLFAAFAFGALAVYEHGLESVIVAVYRCYYLSVSRLKRLFRGKKKANNNSEEKK